MSDIVNELRNHWPDQDDAELSDDDKCCWLLGQKAADTIETLKEQNALLTVQVQEGWKLVPVEPTEEMCEALEGVLRDEGWEADAVGELRKAQCWDAMLAAAPALPQSDARDGTQLPGGVSKGLSAQD